MSHPLSRVERVALEILKVRLTRDPSRDDPHQNAHHISRAFEIAKKFLAESDRLAVAQAVKPRPNLRPDTAAATPTGVSPELPCEVPASTSMWYKHGYCDAVNGWPIRETREIPGGDQDKLDYKRGYDDGWDARYKSFGAGPSK